MRLLPRPRNQTLQRLQKLHRRRIDYVIGGREPRGSSAFSRGQAIGERSAGACFIPHRFS